MIIAGIDPGQKGGVAIIDGRRILLAQPIPVLDKCIDVPELVAILDMYQPDHVVIEQQTIRPMQAGAMAIGSNYGRILASVEYLRLPHTIVTPAVWNRRASIRGKLKGREKKEASFAAANRVFGAAFAALNIPVSKDGVYEAILIARFGL